MKIEFSNTKPKYIEVFEAFTKEINEGRLKANEKLPSKRDLAMDLNLSLNTIMNAYNLLLDEGYIYSLEKKGYFVYGQLEVNKKPEIKEFIEKKKEKPAFDFTTQNMEGFSNSNWKKIIRTEITKEDFLNKTDNLGDYGLRRAIAAHLKENRGIYANPSNILIGNGLEMLERVLKATNINKVSLENPGYHKLAKIALNSNLEVDYLPLDDSGVIVPRERTILYTTPFNQFPTGVKMTIHRKKEIVQYSVDYNTYIIEDDFDAEFRINSNPTTSLYTLCPSNVIFFSTFTETIYPGLRISYCILPDSLLEEYIKLYKDYSSVSTLEQLVLKRFIEEGFYESHINRMKRKYINKRKLILSLLENNPKFICEPKKNYLSILIKVNTNKTDQEIKDILRKNRIKMDLLSDLDIYKRDSHILILGYTAIDMDDIVKGIEKLNNLL